MASSRSVGRLFVGLVSVVLVAAGCGLGATSSPETTSSGSSSVSPSVGSGGSAG